jgi:hypothetical protein
MQPVQQTPARTHSVTKREGSGLSRWPPAVLGRAGVPDDIGPMIAALLSEENHWVNAQRIEVAGGETLYAIQPECYRKQRSTSRRSKQVDSDAVLSLQQTIGSQD